MRGDTRRAAAGGRGIVALMLALAACLVLASACGKGGGGAAAPEEPKGRAVGPRQGLAQFSAQFYTELNNFDMDVRRVLANGALGDMVQRDTYDAVVKLTRERAESVHLDMLCILNPEGKTWLRASNPVERGGSELYETEGSCEAGVCVDMRTLVRRALDQPGTCKPSVEIMPAELLRHEALFSFRVADLMKNGIPAEDLAGRRLDRSVRVPLLARGKVAAETRALMMLDVLPIKTTRGDQVGVLVAGWLLSRTSTLPDSFRLSERTDASLFLEKTRVSTTLALEDQTSVIGGQLHDDVWDQVRTVDEYGVGRLDLGYGPLDVAFQRITDGTGRHIGALLVEQPSLPEGAQIEFVRPSGGGEGGGEGGEGGEAAEGGGEGHGAAEGGGEAPAEGGEAEGGGGH